MKYFLIILSYSLLIPVLALALTFASFTSMNYDLNSHDDTNSSLIVKKDTKHITVQEFLAINDSPEFDSLRSYVSALSLMKTTSIIIIAFNISYLLLIKIFGKAAAINRRLLLAIFKPFYYMTSIMLIMSTIINGILLSATVYYGELFFTNGVHLILLIFLMLSIFIATGLIIRSLYIAFRKYFHPIDGYLVQDGSTISDFLNTISNEYKVPVVDNIIIGESPSFFVTESVLFCDSKIINGKSIYLSSLLMKYLSTDELKSVIIHELAHFKGQDTQYSLKFYPIYRGVFHALNGLHENMVGILSPTMMPAIAMYSFFINSFSEAESKLSRDRELVADSEAIKFTSGSIFSSALIKSTVIINVWSDAITEAEKELYSLSDVADKDKVEFYFNELINGLSLMQYCKKRVLDKSLFHPYDSHPLLNVRIKNSGVELEEILPYVQIVKYDHDF
jgi:Zn-dependent protease with chaperone function